MSLDPESQAVPAASVADRGPVARSGCRKLLYGLFTAVLGLAAVEGLLALCGVPPLRSAADPRTGLSGGLSLFVRDGDRYRTRDEKLTYFNPQSFAVHKPAAGYRIFCLGESTTYGHPYADSMSYVGVLREVLNRAAPATTWEVINCGGISYASYRLADVMRELTAYEPDLIVVYCGQNEFLEERTFRDVRQQSPWLDRAQDVIGRLRLATVLRRPFRGDEAATPDPLIAREVDAILDSSAGPERYRRDPELQRQVVAQYGERLRAICDTARTCVAEVLLIEPASNLRFSPFKSEATDCDLADSLQRDVLIGRAQQAIAAGDETAAAMQWRAVVDRDPHLALAHFGLAESLHAQGEYAAARAEYERALDEDICPLRAISQLIETLREVAKEKQIPLIDFPALVAAYAEAQGGHGVPGEESFLDHVHPRPELHLALAYEILSVQASRDPQRFPTLSTARRVESDVLLATRGRLTDADEALALCNLAQVLTWAGKAREAGPLAEQAVRLAPTDPWILCQHARLLEKQGLVDAADAIYRQALAHQPLDPLANYRLGSLLLDRGEMQAALECLETSQRHLPAGVPQAIKIGLEKALVRARGAFSPVDTLNARPDAAAP